MRPRHAAAVIGFLLTASFMPIGASASIVLGNSNINTLSNGLVAYWPLDGNTINWSTGIVSDLTSNANNGVVTSLSTSSSPVPGKIGQALKFDGVSQYITAPISGFGTTNFATFTAWVYSNANQNSYTGISFSRSAGYGGLQISGGGVGANVLTGGWNNSAGEFNASTGLNIPNGKWTFVAEVVTPTAMTLYMNDQTYVLSQSNPTHTFSTWTIGRDPEGDPTRLWNGAIDDVRVYDRALSPQEISLLNAFGSFEAGNTPAANSSFSIARGGLNAGLVAYWPLDGNTTNWATGVTNDISGNAFVGQMEDLSTTTSPVAGKIGQALKFNGTSSYISIPTTAFANYPSSGNTTSYTQSFTTWFNASGGTILAQTDSCAPPTTCGGFVPAIYIDTSGDVRASMFWHGSTVQIVSGTSYADGKWHYLADVYNNGTETLYIDGASVGSQSVNETGFSSSYDYFLGTGYTSGWPDTNSSWYYLNGSLDDVRVYSRALSAQEVKQLYKVGTINIGHSNTTIASSGTGINSGLAGYWTFDGPAVNWATGVAADASGNGNGAQMVGMSTTSSPVIGKIGQALGFSGSQYLLLPSNEPLSVDTTNDSISAWFKTTSDGVIVSDQNNVPTGSVPSSYDPLIYIETTGLLHAGGYQGGIPALESGSALNDGKWHFAVTTYNGSTQSLYVDGALAASITGTRTGVVSPDDWMIGTGYTSTWTNTNNSWFYFTGSIDDVRIYSRSLSAQEVAQLYAAGK